LDESIKTMTYIPNKVVKIAGNRRIRNELADLGGEKGDGVLGAEGHEAASSPRDVVHHTVAADPYEDPLHLHAPALSAGSSELSGSRRHHE
jgi:hypothetical protein